jgi:tetratricopeptide (TPR) repeat protein
MDPIDQKNRESDKELTKENLDKMIHSFQDQAAVSLTELIKISVPELANSPELKKEVLSSIDIAPGQQRISSAFKSITNYLQSSLSPVERQEIEENWMQSFQQFSELLESKKAMESEDSIKPLQELIGLSSQTYDLFYAAGRDLYENEAFEKASDIFFLLTILNYCYSNVWISLGLCEQKCNHLETALKAFSMAVITNPESPEPYLCAADCCIAMNDLSEANIYLEQAMPRLKDPQYESFRAVASRISQQLKSSSNSR